jgi:hypothetical protein
MAADIRRCLAKSRSNLMSYVPFHYMLGDIFMCCYSHPTAKLKETRLINYSRHTRICKPKIRHIYLKKNISIFIRKKGESMKVYYLSAGFL